MLATCYEEVSASTFSGFISGILIGKLPRIPSSWTNKAIVNSRLRPRCAIHNEYFRSLSLSTIWLKFRLLCVFYRHLGMHATRHRVVIHKTGSTYHNTVTAGPSHGHGQYAQKFGEVRPCGFKVMRADRQADRQTDRQTSRHTHHNTSHPSEMGSEVNNKFSRKLYETNCSYRCRCFVTEIYSEAVSAATAVCRSFTSSK